jgi:glycosyltransferase involved in cell wall biosynthesis
MNRPLVSVVIATYNMARYLPLAVRSALDQTYGNIEVLVVDDGSTDDTQNVMEPFLDDSRVKYYTQENKGQAAAKNHGVRESRGDYIAFLDADDMWVPDKLELQMPLFVRSQAVGVVYSAFTNMDETGKLLEKPPCKLYRGRVTGPLLIFNFVGFGTSVVKRECFERLGLFNENLRMGIDYELWLRFSTHYEFDYIDRPLLYYREWPGQISRNWNSRYLNGIQIMKSFLRDFPGAVDKRTADEAWAHTYAGFGLCVRSSKGRRNEALNLYLRALRYKPGYFPAWRGIVATILCK